MKIEDIVPPLLGGLGIGLIAKYVFGVEFALSRQVIMMFIASVSMIVGLVSAVLTWKFYDWSMSGSDFWHSSPIEYYSGKFGAAVFSLFLAGALTFWIMGYYFCVTSGLGSELRKGCRHETPTNNVQLVPVTPEAATVPVSEPPQTTDAVVPRDTPLNPEPSVEQSVNESVGDSSSSSDNSESSTKEN